MMRKIFFLLILVFVILSTQNFIFADIVYFQNGSKQEGIVKDIPTAPDMILLINGNGEVRISRSRIKSIEKEDECASLIKVGDQLFALQNYDSALEDYKLASQIQPENKEILNKIALTESEINKLQEEAKVQNLQQIEDLLRESEKLAKDKKFEEAEAKVKQALAFMPPERVKNDINKTLSNLYYDWAINKLDHVNPVGASELLEKVREIDPDNVRASKKLLELWENNPAKTADVIEAYESLLKNDKENVEIMKKLADLYFKQGRNEETLALSLKIYKADPNSQKTLAPVLKKLFVDECNKLTEARNYTKAFETYKRYQEIFPGVDPTPLDLYEYAERLSKIDPKDIAKKLEVAQFAKEKNLTYQTKELLKEILFAEPRNPKALELLNFYGAADLEEAKGFFSRGEYLTAKVAMKKIIDEYALLPDVVREASSLLERSDYESKKNLRAKLELAQDLMTEGDNYYNKAINHLNMWRSTDINRNIRVINDKNEAVKYLQRAVKAWEAAIDIDASLAEMGKGDLNSKIADAKQKTNALLNPVALPLPNFSNYNNSSK